MMSQGFLREQGVKYGQGGQGGCFSSKLTYIELRSSCLCPGPPHPSDFHLCPAPLENALSPASLIRFVEIKMFT